MQLKHVSAVTVVCASLLSAAPSAFAQTSAQDGYSQPAGSIQQQLGAASEQHPDAQVHRPGRDVASSVPSVLAAAGTGDHAWSVVAEYLEMKRFWGVTPYIEQALGDPFRQFHSGPASGVREAAHLGEVNPTASRT